MNNTRAVLDALSGMNSSAQRSVPFTPNNGNPGGAYNMPQSKAVQQPSQASDPWPWLQPSPFMQALQQNLIERGERIKRDIQESVREPIIPQQQQQPQQAAPVAMQQPPIPIQNSPSMGINHRGIPDGFVMPVRAF